VIFGLAVLLGAAFGGADQYLGSLAAVPWATATSLLSAPWLVLPFCFGWTQVSARRAVLVGTVATYAALVAYGAMTLSPIEGARLTDASALGFVHSEARVLIGGVVTGPLYGLLGQRWRTRRAWISAFFVAGAVMLEPLAKGIVGRMPTPNFVPISEFALGVLMAVAFLIARVAHRRHKKGTLHQLG
jgi:hypothetical protein